MCCKRSVFSISLNLFFLFLSHVSFAVASYSHLDSHALVVSASALSSPVKALFIVTNNRVGINKPVPGAVLDFYNGSGASLLNVNSSGYVGVGLTTQSQQLAVEGNVQLYNGQVIYQSSTSGQTNGDWKLFSRDDCNGYTNGADNSWKSRTGTDYTTVTALTVSPLRKYLGDSSSGTTGAIVGYVYKDYTLPTHTWVKVIVAYYAIDSWDGEYAYVLCTDGTSTGTTMLEWKRQYIGGLGINSSNFGGASGYTDHQITGELQGRHTSSTLRVYVGSTLDQSPSDESFGVGSVEIWIR